MLKTSLTAATLSRESGIIPAEYQANRTLANIYNKLGEFEKAAAALRTAVDAARRSGQQQNEANVDLNLAGSYEVLGQWDDALQAVEKSLEISHAIGDKQGEALADAELAELYGDRTSSIKDFDKAMSYYEAAKKLGLTSNVDILEVYIQTGRYGEAIAAANELLKACTNTKDTDCQGHALLSRAEAERKSANLKGAAFHCKPPELWSKNLKTSICTGGCCIAKLDKSALKVTLARPSIHTSSLLRSLKVSKAKVASEPSDLLQRPMDLYTTSYIHSIFDE